MDHPEELLLPSPHEELLPAHIGGTPTYALKTLISWSAPGRPFEKRNKEYFLNVLIIMLLVEVILFLFSQYILMALVLSLVFLSYALNTVAPHNFHYKVTSEGIQVEDHFFLWQELYDFYLKRQGGVDIAVIATKMWYPGELILVLGEVHPDHLRDILVQYLPYREYVKPTFVENSARWLEKNFPLDRSSHTSMK